MAVSMERKLVFVLMGLVSLASFGLRHSVHAQDGAGILFQRALFCFDNRQIYTGCNEAFRLNESGEIKVPPEATELFCNGPCLAETELVLKCIDNIMSNFVFYNRATSRDIRNALHGGCSSSFRRGKAYNPHSCSVGNFNTGYYSPELAFGRAEKNLPSLIIVRVSAIFLAFAPLFL